MARRPALAMQSLQHLADDDDDDAPVDAMAAAERQAGGVKGPSFVASTKDINARQQEEQLSVPAANADEIHISDEEDL